MPQPTYIARRLPLCRGELGLSQRGLANELGVSIATVQSWEQSLREPAGDALDVVERIIALGERGEGEDDPLYLIAGTPEPLLDAKERSCVVRARHPAKQVVDFLRSSGVAEAAVVPIWQDHLDTLPQGQCVGLNVDVELADYNADLLRWASEVLVRHGAAAR